jgi:hypothetical protein
MLDERRRAPGGVPVVVRCWVAAAHQAPHGEHYAAAGASFEGRRTDLAERRMPAPLVVKHFDESNNSIFASPKLAKRSANSIVTGEKKLSMTALSSCGARFLVGHPAGASSASL